MPYLDDRGPMILKFLSGANPEKTKKQLSEGFV